MRRLTLSILVFLLSLLAAAQQKYEHLNQIWASYYSSIKLNHRWAISSDMQGRTTDWYKQWLQVIGRTGVVFRPNEKFSVSLGFADFLYFGKENKANRNEYRPWGELAINDSYGKIKISNRFRFEDRNFQQILNDELVDKFSSNFRFRYRIDLQYPIWKKKESEQLLSVLFGNEVMLNAGKNIIYNYFDQNRTWTGLQFTANKKWAFQLQYVYILQQLSNGTTIDQINTVRVNVYHTINLVRNDNSTTK